MKYIIRSNQFKTIRHLYKDIDCDTGRVADEQMQLKDGVFNSWNPSLTIFLTRGIPTSLVNSLQVPHNVTRQLSTLIHYKGSPLTFWPSNSTLGPD